MLTLFRARLHITQSAEVQITLRSHVWDSHFESYFLQAIFMVATAAAAAVDNKALVSVRTWVRHRPSAHPAGLHSAFNSESALIDGGVARVSLLGPLPYVPRLIRESVHTVSRVIVSQRWRRLRLRSWLILRSWLPRLEILHRLSW